MLIVYVITHWPLFQTNSNSAPHSSAAAEHDLVYSGPIEPWNAETSMHLQEINVAPRSGKKARTEAALHYEAVSEEAHQILFVKQFRPKCECKLVCGQASIVEVMNLRKAVWGRVPNRSLRKQTILNILKHLSIPLSSNTDSFKGSVAKQPHYMIGPLNVCEKAFCDAAKINDSGRMFRGLKVLAFEENKGIPPRRRFGSSGERGRKAISWLLNYANKHGDFSPVSEDKRFLAERLKVAVHKRYVAAIGAQALKQARFYQLWKQHCKLICCAKETAGFKRCQSCVTLDDVVMRPGLTVLGKKAVEFLLERHLAQQMSERMNFEAAKDLALDTEGKFVMIADGMDQKKSEIPGWGTEFKTRPSEKMQAVKKIGQFVIGVRVWYNLNGPKQKLYLYVCDDLLKKDSNSTIHCIHSTLLDLIDQFQKANKPVPDFLRVNFDNASENKCQYILGYFSDITRRKMFNNVSVCYLYRGHTHSEIDQAFSKLAAYLRRNRTVTPSLFDGVAGCVCHDLNTVVTRVKFTNDWKSYYEDDLITMSGITKPHQFMFWCDGERCLSQYRMWSDTRWYPNRFIPVVTECGVISDMDELEQALNQRLVDTAGLPIDSVIDATRITLPDIMRVPNELTVDFVEWLAEYKPIESIPGIAPFHSISEMISIKADITRAYYDPEVTLFTDPEYEELQTYSSDRMHYVTHPELIVTTWRWPIIVRDAIRTALTNPYITIAEYWKIVDVNGFLSLAKRDQGLMKGIRFEHCGPVGKLMKTGKQKVSKAAKESKKAKSKAKSRSRSSRMDDDDDDDESVPKSSSESSGDSDDGNDTESGEEGSSSSDGESRCSSSASSDNDSDGAPKRRTRTGKSY